MVLIKKSDYYLFKTIKTFFFLCFWNSCALILTAHSQSKTFSHIFTKKSRAKKQKQNKTKDDIDTFREGSVVSECCLLLSPLSKGCGFPLKKINKSNKPRVKTRIEVWLKLSCLRSTSEVHSEVKSFSGDEVSPVLQHKSRKISLSRWH